MSEQKTIHTRGADRSGSTRRAFHLAVIYVLGALIGLMLAIPTILYLLVPPKSRKDSGFIDAGDVSQLTPGVPVALSFQKTRLDGWRLETEKKTAWVVKGADSKIVAFGPQCTHLACAYHWEMESGKFMCPCHGSYFSVEGKVLAGPAPRPLDRYLTKVENNRLQIGELQESKEGLTAMRKKIEQFIEHLDHRTGLHSGLRHFLYEEIPASSGWHQVFGSVALFLMLVQFFTGAMLAFNYAPTPGDAYSSVRYIMTEVTAGRMMRGLHHWGASMIIVIVVLHMVQVFLWGAYKKPREGTWIVGVILLLLTLAYGLTGYLLPWDNRAYWGTTVTTKIGATVPIMGPYVSRLLASTGDIGVVTFARFYGLHVLLLPPATLLLIVLHVYMVRRHGVAPAPGDDAKPKKSFFPEQVFKDTVAVFIAFVILFVMALVVRVPLERMADPTDFGYIPRPEWYFLFLFETLAVLKGLPDVLGTVVLPTIAILALILTPFIDRSKLVRVRQRTLAAGVAVLAGLGWGGLTLAAIRGTAPQTAAEQIDFSGPTQWMQLGPVEMAGIHYFREQQCATCHNVTGDTPKAGPNLLNTARRHDAAWLTAHFADPAKATPNSTMKPVNLSDTGLRSLVALMLVLTPDNGDVIGTAPDFAVEGALLFQKNSCGDCHQLNGVGEQVGPPLNGLAGRRNEAWVIQHFQNPKMMVPNSSMPPFKFNASEMQNMVSYLMTLPDKAPGQ